jgi:hypothetical protein
VPLSAKATHFGKIKKKNGSRQVLRFEEKSIIKPLQIVAIIRSTEKF